MLLSTEFLQIANALMATARQTGTPHETPSFSGQHCPHRTRGPMEIYTPIPRRRWTVGHGVPDTVGRSSDSRALDRVGSNLLAVASQADAQCT